MPVRRRARSDGLAGVPAVHAVPEPADPAGEQQPSDNEAPASGRTLLHRLRVVYGSQVGPVERSLLVSWAAFGVTFGLTRALTYWLHAGHGPAGGGIVIRGQHFHHYNIGIAMIAGVGAVAVRGVEAQRHPVTAATYGSGSALIVDELALLIDLQDVYWAKEGRQSVDAAIGAIAVGGVYLAAAPFWHGAAHEVARTVPKVATPRRAHQ